MLAPDRSVEKVNAFLDHFLPHRNVSTTEFFVLESSAAPEKVFHSEREIMAYLEEHPEEPYGLYWNDANMGSFDVAMAFYTSDGQVIYGLAFSTQDPAGLLGEMEAFVGTTYSLRDYGGRPPSCSEEFINLSNSQGFV